MKVLISDKLSEKGIEVLRQAGDIEVEVNTDLEPADLIKVIGDYEGLIIRSGTKVTREVIEAAGKLKAVARAGVGVDNVDVDAATERGIVVMNTPGGNTVSTAEHTMALMLSLPRSIPRADQSLREGRWDRKKYMGVQLYGKTLGIVGLGRIGSEVAMRARAFGMKTIACDPFTSPEQASRLGVELVEMDGILSRSDYITVHTPITSETRHMISDDQFAEMKDGVRIVNCARGGIIDEAALLRAIESGKVAGAALDVYENEPPTGNPLLSRDEVVATPHLGASTREAQVEVAIEAAEQMVEVLRGGAACNAVNLPPVDSETYQRIRPYVLLAEKMGALQAQIVEGNLKSVRIDCSGDDMPSQLAPITAAMLKGLLERGRLGEVNYINSPLMARRAGIEVVESRSLTPENYLNLIRIEVETSKGKSSAEGTLFGKVDPRIVRINGYHVDAVPEGTMMLLCGHSDEPGIIGKIGTVLGAHSINIAGMTLGRREAGEREISVMNIDAVVPPEVLEEIRAIVAVDEVRLIRL